MAIILFASDKQLTPDHQPVIVKGSRSGRDITVWVRGELQEDAYPGPALMRAAVKPDEIALNAIPNGVIIRQPE